MTTIVNTQTWRQPPTGTAIISQSSTVAWRSLVNLKHYPWQLVDFAILPVMILLTITFFMGGQMMGSWQDFLQYGGPGIIAMGAMFATLNTALGFHSDLKTGIFDRLSSMPVSRVALIAGRVLADLLKHTWAILIVAAVAVAIGYRPEADVWSVLGAVGVLLIFLAAISWFMVFIGLTAKSEEQIQTYMISILMPIAFSSSVYIEVETMPQVLQWWANVNPMTYLADSVRALLNGTDIGASLWGLLAWCAALTAIFLPLALRAYRRRLNS
ncbi:ABC transporter permease [Natronoglycomyces albus]|uniref:Transport permease protein n=1 Tax=Natronoglycomyces albus TaxID=2811108 RepID=A0A895XKS0_9ACTN|nr:ABC transporter permease [Natronoglycomyces albus]QSB06321.1 ABC transporter permease [Natronoglycomyces albus]